MSYAKNMKHFIFLVALVLLPLYAQTNITHLNIKGPISPATSDYLHKGFAYAVSNNSELIFITLDTPGGLGTSMREMIQDILSSSIPVVVFVSPKGARAASAGTYLLYAAHIAAMSPGTNLGAATPVNFMQRPKQDKNRTLSAMEKKVINDSVAYIKSLAQLRDRNIPWAIEAVTEGKSLSSADALKKGVIDFVAENDQDLLRQIEGKTFSIEGKTMRLSLKGAEHLYYEADWKSRFLAIVSNPTIAYILLLVGAYGIFFELMNPGGLFPGITGLISGIIALYALNLLPFSYAGLFLILFGLALMVAELFVSGFGILGIAGVLSFVMGSLLLFDTQTLGHQISLPLIIALGVTSLVFFMLVLRYVIASRSQKPVAGVEEMIGMSADIIKREGEGYRVRCHGELWKAQSSKPLNIGDKVTVSSVDGLILKLDKE
jgi:membrane-bound serine protease (ClpP class)